MEINMKDMFLDALRVGKMLAEMSETYVDAERKPDVNQSFDYRSVLYQVPMLNSDWRFAWLKQ